MPWLCSVGKSATDAGMVRLSTAETTLRTLYIGENDAKRLCNQLGECIGLSACYSLSKH